MRDSLLLPYCVSDTRIAALDLDDELEDSALDSVSGAEFPEATPDQLAQLESSLTAVREVIGSEQGTDAGGLSDKELRSQLWESYFDVEGTVSWALGGPTFALTRRPLRLMYDYLCRGATS